MGETITIEFNQKDLDEYILEWKKKYPRKKKIPIEKPMVRSLNKILNTNGLVRNSIKHEYIDYVCWIVRKYNLYKIGINNADLEVKFIFPTLTLRDIDNYIGGCKEFIDGFTTGGVVVDDSSKYIKSISATMGYEKDVTKTIFKFKNCTFDKDELEISMEKQRVKKEKSEKTKADKKAKKLSLAKKKKDTPAKVNTKKTVKKTKIK